MPVEAGKYKIRSITNGQPEEIDVNLNDYRDAAERGVSLSTYLSMKHGEKTDEENFGSVFQQMMAAAGLYMRHDPAQGITPPNLKDIVDGKVRLAGITNGSGDGTTPSSRLIFPEVILQVMSSVLLADDSDFFRFWNKLFATTLSVNGEVFQQPMINATHNENTRSKGISQGTEPANMVNITLSDKAGRIPTKAIGLTIADQALRATTLDLVALVTAAQARGERIANAHEILNGILSGDVDMGETGITSDGTFQALDSAITTAGTITHKALVKYLREKYRYLQPNLLIMDLDTAFAVENRAGKPNWQINYNAEGTNFGLQPTVDNLLASAPPIMIVETAVVGANTIIGIDTTKAMRRVVNVNAAYEAVENFVMRRITAFRWDYSETGQSIWKEAFSKRTLTV